MTLRWRRLFPHGRLAQISWSRKAPGEEFPLHDHDFPEVFWVAEGELEHAINGSTERLRRGELIFIRPADRHGFVGCGAGGGVLINLAVRTDLVDRLRRRHCPASRETWWDPSPRPARILLTAAELHALDQAARELAAPAEPDLLETERFLLNLFHLLRQREGAPRPQDEPGWLTAARQTLTDPAHLAEGVAHLTRRAGCSPEHLARTVRRVHGLTPTELVNRQRLDWAAGELMFTGRGIADVALAAGFESLSHFYHLFRRQHGVTPRQFRLRARALT